MRMLSASSVAGSYATAVPWDGSSDEGLVGGDDLVHGERDLPAEHRHQVIVPWQVRLTSTGRLAGR